MGYSYEIIIQVQKTSNSQYEKVYTDRGHRSYSGDLYHYLNPIDDEISESDRMELERLIDTSNYYYDVFTFEKVETDFAESGLPTYSILFAILYDFFPSDLSNKLTIDTIGFLCDNDMLDGGWELRYYYLKLCKQKRKNHNVRLLFVREKP